ncbi:MAG TPA: MaoC family dehydratase N-terminal domain-containing protein [Candidatus Acidoferrales bacterium]|nr:MaoC family dehydratase N-terminal domain-containing protein [Candidatus Acidoferrales bacterium]
MATTSVNIDHLREWIGKSETREDRITLTPMAALSATLDRDDPFPRDADPLPPLWHWLYFLPLQRESELGADGHPKRGRFIPPVPLPRRMFAGGRQQFHKPLRAGDAISRVSRVADVTHKTGRNGPLVFVLVRHEISTREGLALVEEHDIVYREHSRPGEGGAQPQATPVDAAWSREIRADAVMLFRYSALTFNPHRIHYDLRYCTDVEGYPGLVVHGPLIATTLADLLRRNLPDARVAHFSFRALRPIFDTHPFSVHGRLESGNKTVKLWAKDHEGWLCMEATATLA